MALVLVLPYATAQTPPAPRSQLVGNVTAVDAAGARLSLVTDKGETVTVATLEKTVIVRMPVGETDIKRGRKMALSGLGAGDRVVAFVRKSDAGLEATSLVVRTKADLAEAAGKELEDWRKRGTAGTVTAVDADARTITLKAGQKSITLETNEKTEYRRYSPDSAKPSDARPSRLAEIQAGDQVNALGDRDEAGTKVKAERIFAGTFRQFAATVLGVDAASGEVRVKELVSKKPLIIVVNGDSTLKKLPEGVARMLALRYRPAGPAAESGEASPRPAGGPGRPRERGDVHQLLERAPHLPLGELKSGDAVMVSTTMGSDPARVTAIMLLAGVEPLLTASPAATRDIMAGWNLGGAGAEAGQ